MARRRPRTTSYANIQNTIPMERIIGDSIYNPGLGAVPTTYTTGITQPVSTEPKKRLFAFLDRFGKGKSLFNSDMDLSLSGINKKVQDIGATKITKGGNATLGQVGGALYGGKQALDLINSGTNLGNSFNDLRDARADVLSSAYANPLVDSYLSADQRKTLRQVRNGSFDSQNAWGAAAGGVASSIPQALAGAALGYLSSGGNPLMAILGGGSKLAQGGMQGVQNMNNNKQSRLEALYTALNEAEQDYRSMRRPDKLRAAGLSSRAYNGLY